MKHVHPHAFNWSDAQREARITQQLKTLAAVAVLAVLLVNLIFVWS